MVLQYSLSKECNFALSRGPHFSGALVGVEGATLNSNDSARRIELRLSNTNECRELGVQGNRRAGKSVVSL